MVVGVEMGMKSEMSDLNDRVPENVPGSYYVDWQCIDCEVCRTNAPDNFRRSEDGYSFVKQPETEEERELCEDGLDGLSRRGHWQ